MKFQPMYVQTIVSRLLTMAIVMMGFCAMPVSASIALQSAWSEFAVEAKPFLARGIESRKIIEDAFMLDEQEALTVTSTQVFIELFDALLTKIRQTSALESGQTIQDFRDHLFNNVLSVFVLRQKLALEVFRQHKKWNIVMTDTGLVSSVDKDVLVAFIGSLKSVFFDLTGGGLHFASPEDLMVLCRLIDNISRQFKSHPGLIALKGAKNVAASGLRAGTHVTGKAVSSVYSKGRALVRKVDGPLIKRVLRTAGSVSAIALFLGSCYMINNKKRLARELIDGAGGFWEVKMTAAKLYTFPEARFEQVKTWFKDWAFSGQEFRDATADELGKSLITSGDLDVLPSQQGPDNLRQILLKIARKPKSVKVECIKKIEEAMARDVRCEGYASKKRSGMGITEKVVRSGFEKKAKSYLRAMGKLPSGWKQFSSFVKSIGSYEPVYVGMPISSQPSVLQIPTGIPVDCVLPALSIYTGIPINSY